ncbi:MAG: hypothetical protein MUF45_09190 [Spirosomaceae bacterium]|jgi:hypothetical protein|nr:hypothetical protein [Spirosomataceae bacterium]
MPIQTLQQPVKKNKNVFTPQEIHKMGGIQKVLDKFKKKRQKPITDLEFSDSDWNKMLNHID